MAGGRSTLPVSPVDLAASVHLSVEHVSDLIYPNQDPPCHFCDGNKSEPIHGEARLRIVSGGLVSSRDGGRCGHAYMNLPSPNVQSEDGSDVFPAEDRCLGISEEEPGLQEAPPASAMGRRSALVPPKLIPTDAEADEEKARKLSEGSSENGTARNRRSSMVVIPPMQICPGDLLVYSKVLTHRSNLLESHLYGSAQSLAAPDSDSTCSRKGRTTWSILKLFDRSGRSLKSESLTGIEQVLMEIRPSEFRDEQLHRYKGLPWSDFVYHVEAGTLRPLAAGHAAGLGRG
ncbi:uncharacterized protein LOC119098246 [Pollicipes pollicipes]|uniref:uncharacterized protein LOC119098246 n=1 Tax=Pollicipes pollicipes TaxID=41117 RepID=UPI001884D949|nr:uncharacterized protein LOC119098246 [Pollicipes pollicipes]